MPGTVVRDANETDLLNGLALNSTGTKTGTALEVLWPGRVQFVVETGTITGTTPTMDVTLQGCETSDFTTDPVVELGTVNLVGTDDDSKFAVETHVDARYVRAVAVIGGTSPVFTGTTVKVVPNHYHRARGAHPTAAALA